MTKINEGFWDSVVTSVKRGALAVGAAAGSKSAQGKLSAENLAKQLYDAYKVWKGETGEDDNGQAMADFLGNEVQFSSNFSKEWGQNFDSYLANPKEFLKQMANKGAQPGDQAQEQPQQNAEPEASAAPESGGEPQGPAVLEPQIKKALLDQARPDTFNQYTSGRKPFEFKTDPDGSFVVVDAGKEEAFKKILSKSKTPQELATSLYNSGFFDLWDNFKLENKSYSKDPDVIARDALMAAADKLGKNYIKSINRYVVMKPQSEEEFELRESELTEGWFDDSKVRKFLFTVAQQALRTGEAKSAAREQIKVSARKNSDAQPQQQSQQAEPKAGEAPKPAEEPKQSATTQSSSAPTEVKLAGLNLSDQQQALLDTLEGENGLGLSNAMNTGNKDVMALAKRIIDQALRDYRTVKGKK